MGLAFRYNSLVYAGFNGRTGHFFAPLKVKGDKAVAAWSETKWGLAGSSLRHYSREWSREELEHQIGESLPVHGGMNTSYPTGRRCLQQEDIDRVFSKPEVEDEAEQEEASPVEESVVESEVEDLASKPPLSEATKRRLAELG